MKTLATLTAAAAIVLLCIVGYAYSGLYDVRASAPHSGIVDWLLSTTSHASIERRASGIEVPELDDETLVLAGINDFDAMCTGCHGAPGRDPDPMGQGLNPPAPDLQEEAAEMTPAELFWVTKNGIRMTGMPAWGKTHDDDSIWPVVAFMTRLPAMDEAGYQQLLAEAAGSGHHGEGSAGEARDHTEAEGSSGGAVHVHEDGSEHVHDQATPPDLPPDPEHPR